MTEHSIFIKIIIIFDFVFTRHLGPVTHFQGRAWVAELWTSGLDVHDHQVIFLLPVQLLFPAKKIVHPGLEPV